MRTSAFECNGRFCPSEPRAKAWDVRAGSFKRLLRVPCFGVAFLAAWVLCVPIAGAQKTPQGPQQTEYDRLIEYAVEEFGRENWSEARAFFDRAHRLRPTARTLRGLGMVAYEMHHYVEAEARLLASLRAEDNPLTEEQRQSTHALLDRVQTLIGRFSVRVQPPDAQLFVDGRPIRPQDGELKLTVGLHNLLVQRPGYADLVRKLDVRGGEHTRLPLALTPLATSAPPSVPTAAQVAGVPEPTDEQDEGGSSIWSSPWLWVGAAIVVAAGVTLAVVATTPPPEDPRAAVPNTGVVIRTLQVAP